MVNNKYYRWYMNIIMNARNSTRVRAIALYEEHHILPQTMGGGNDKENLVLLTYKEHYVCHHLLTKFTEGEYRAKMMFAFWGMTNKWGRAGADYRITAKTYSILKEEIAYLISKNNKGKSYPVTEETRRKIADTKVGDKNPMYGKPAPNRGMTRPGIGGRKKGTAWSSEERARQMQVRSVPGYYDFLKCPERGRKISESKKGCNGSASGKHWYNNGIIETYADSAPDGFNPGRLYRNMSNKVGMRWYNNGVVNRQFKEGQVEEGFVRGRIIRK